MKEDDDMLTIALTPRLAAPPPPEAAELSTVPTELLARLDRLAQTSLHAAGLAHEVANPLGALLGTLEAVEARVREMRRRGAATPDDLEALATDLELTSAATGAITDIVHDFQRFLRPDDGRAVPLANVREAVERALRIARPRLGVTTRVDLQLRDVPPVRAPHGRIAQVVLNLLLNATEAVGGRPSTENLVSVRLDAGGGRTLIEVSDNGPGLPPALRDRFFPTPGSVVTPLAPGGLGLQISRELVRKMGGDIAVASLPNAGTTFIVSLPVA